MKWTALAVTALVGAAGCAGKADESGAGKQEVAPSPEPVWLVVGRPEAGLVDLRVLDADEQVRTLFTDVFELQGLSTRLSWDLDEGGWFEVVLVPSPDHRAVAWGCRGCRLDHDPALTVVELETGEAHTWQDIRVSYEVKWSPDGRWLAAATTDVAPHRVHLVNARGERRTVLETSRPVAHVSWSSDNQHLLVLQATDESSTRYDLTVVSIDGGAHALASGVRLCLDDGYPGVTWSPDGSRVLFVEAPPDFQVQRDGVVRFRTVRVDGSDSTTLLELPWTDYEDPPELGPPAPSFHDRCSFSPDGSSVVIDTPDRLWAAPIDGSGAQTLVPKEAWRLPLWYPWLRQWSPDRKRLVYSAWEEGAIVVRSMDADGGSSRTLASASEAASVRWLWGHTGRVGLLAAPSDATGLEERSIIDLETGASSTVTGMGVVGFSPRDDQVLCTTGAGWAVARRDGTGVLPIFPDLPDLKLGGVGYLADGAQIGAAHHDRVYVTRPGEAARRVWSAGADENLVEVRFPDFFSRRRW